MKHRPLFALFNLAAIIFVLGSYVIVAQNAVTGEWTGKAKADKPDQIHLSFEVRKENGGRNQHGTNFKYSDLQGLSADQTQNGAVSFRLVREAGSIECQGTFANGAGSGTFRFVPNYAWADQMKSRGFDFSQSGKHGSSTLEERLFVATTLNVTTATADGLRAAGFNTADVEDLFKAAIFKITPEFMAEMKATGFPNLEMEDLVKARIFKIDADYVRQVSGMGFTNNDFEGLVKFRIFKVTPEFLNQLKAEGLTDLSKEDIVKMRIFNIDADYVRTARANNPSVTVEQMVEMKIGVRRQ